MKNARKLAAVLSMGMALSAVTGMNALAADKAFQLDVANWTDQDWNSIAMTNDDTVTSGVIIRADASSDSEAVGYLYRGGAVNIVNKGDEWTEIRSGSVTGYVRNEYIVSGDAARGLAEHYGKEGVVANWDDVNVYAAKDAASVTKTVAEKTAFPLVSDEGHWLLVQQGADDAGYISEEDASRMLLVDTAVPADGEDQVSTYVENLGGTAAAPAAAEDVSAAADVSAAGSSDAGTASDTGAAGSDAGAAGSDAGAAGSDAGAAGDNGAASDAAAESYDAGTASDAGADGNSGEDISTDYDVTSPGGSASGADATVSSDVSASSETDPSSQQLPSQTVSSDANVQALYDAYVEAQNAAMNCTTAEDANAKAQAAIDAYNAYVAAANGASYSADASTQTNTAAQTEAPQTEAPQTEVPQTEAPQTEAPQTEAPQTEAPQTEAPASSGTGSYADFSDLDLLAAIIWCEAGNQPYDGMVAVGEVVMNRVASPSFPNTIAEVLEQPGQFSPYSSGRLQSALAAGVNSTCYQAAQDALNGAQPVPGALYFNTHSGTTKLGDHYFS